MRPKGSSGRNSQTEPATSRNSSSLFSYEFVYTPDSIPGNGLKMRDENDIPILYTAKREHVDIILTDDKDFTSLNLDSPKILSPSEFLTIELKQE